MRHRSVAFITRGGKGAKIIHRRDKVGRKKRIRRGSHSPGGPPTLQHCDVNHRVWGGNEKRLWEAWEKGGGVGWGRSRKGGEVSGGLKCC